MIPKTAILRIARPTDNLSKITDMYIKGLGFVLLGEFQDHDGFDGAIIGHKKHSYHFEFTHHRGTTVGTAPTKDNLLVFYFVDNGILQSCFTNMTLAGFKEVSSYNPYWNDVGKTLEDLDGYRVVLVNQAWQE